MKNKSIKTTILKMLKYVFVFLVVFILPINIWLQLRIIHNNQLQSSSELFKQVEDIIVNSREDIEEKISKHNQKTIHAAEIVAYYVEHEPEVIQNHDLVLELASKINVDEIHFFNPEGELVSGTHPQYYGYSFDSGEQMEFFLPMLEDHSLKLCQEIAPNLAEHKDMQYAAVWMKDESYIVQIGISAQHLLNEIKERSLTNLLSSNSLILNGYLHIVDMDNYEVIASNSSKLNGIDMYEEASNHGFDVSDFYHYEYEGKDYCVYTHQFQHYLFIRSYPLSELVHSILLSTISIALYILIISVAITGSIGWYINKKITSNLSSIVNELEKIEEGDISNMNITTYISEFDNLILYINQLLNSVRFNLNRIPYVMDKLHIPIGILEINLFYKKAFFNHFLLEILHLNRNDFSTHEQFIDRIMEEIYLIESKPVSLDRQVYEYVREGKKIYIRMLKSEDDQSLIYSVADVSLYWNEIDALREQKNKDALTNLYNRRGFEEQMNELFSLPHQLGNAVMIVFDADGLKRINDFYGHPVGDEYLKEITHLIQSCLDQKYICARLGGDEFIIFAYGYASVDELERLIHNIQSMRGSEFRCDNYDVHETIEFSLGYACYPQEANDYASLMKQADKNMYEEKRMRKSQ